MKRRKGKCPFKQFITTTWSNLQRRTVNGKRPEWTNRRMVRDYLSKGIEIRMTRQEFAAWCHERRDLIMKLKTISDSPSVDRIDSRGHYEASNMRIISWNENRRLAAHARKAEVNAYIESLPPKFCPICKTRLVRSIYTNGWREPAEKFKLRIYCSKKCARTKAGKRMSELEEIVL